MPVICPGESKCHNQAHSLYWTTPGFSEIVQLNILCSELHFLVDLVEYGATKSRTIKESR